MDMNHKPEQMAAAYRAALNAILPAADRITIEVAQAKVTAYLEASPAPPRGEYAAEKLLDGIVRALR